MLHTAQLVKSFPFLISLNKQPAVQKQMKHDLFAVLTKQTEHIGPGVILQQRDILIRILRDNTPYA